ncbi:hypothetical protein [Eikenella longinqua]|nr:hypothetical protein [Eikenella longinqua]
MSRWLLLSGLWFAGMVYALLLHEGGNTPPPFAHFDKVVHAGLFFGQFWLLAKVFLQRRRAVPVRALLAAALVLAAGSEWAQGTLTASRQADWLDAAADMAGAAAALYFAVQVQAARGRAVVKKEA